MNQHYRLTVEGGAALLMTIVLSGFVMVFWMAQMSMSEIINVMLK